LPHEAQLCRAVFGKSSARIIVKWAHPFSAASSEEIDFRATSEVFAPFYDLKPKDLETLGLVTKYQARLVPTNAGVLLFGKAREKIFPDVWIQTGRFQGIDKTNIIDSMTIHKYPILAIEDAMAFIEKHAMIAIDIKQIRHQVRWNVPGSGLIVCFQ